MKRFAITFETGHERRLAFHNWGINHFDSEEKAWDFLGKMILNTSWETIKMIYGPTPNFQVTEIECWPHGDSKRTVFDIDNYLK